MAFITVCWSRQARIFLNTCKSNMVQDGTSRYSVFYNKNIIYFYYKMIMCYRSSIIPVDDAQ